jgi:hypothetical protein
MSIGDEHIVISRSMVESPAEDGVELPEDVDEELPGP